jgi:hypothetical protein
MGVPDYGFGRGASASYLRHCSRFSFSSISSTKYITNTKLFSFAFWDGEGKIRASFTSALTVTDRDSDKYNAAASRLGYRVAQLVQALCYKPERRGFDSRWCHWDFSLT